VAPPKLPRPIKDSLLTELDAVFKNPEAITKCGALTKTVPETNPLISEASKKQVPEELKNWKAVVKREKSSFNSKRKKAPRFSRKEAWEQKSRRSGARRTVPPLVARAPAQC
jgi:hypothetical protein